MLAVQSALAATAMAEEPRPFLKWAGSKRQLMHALLPRVPDKYGTFFEPFVGAGALFFALGPQRAVLADTNARLVRTYQGIRDDVKGVIALLQSYPHDKAFFYRMRDVDIDARSDAEVAAWFIYLNKTGYNGLYRVNRANRFNVPFGRHHNPTICDAPNLRACAAALADTEIRVADFEHAVRGAARGDFVYFDPPYVPLSATSSFTSYTSGGFGPADQVRLRDLALKLKRKRVSVLLSNSSAKAVRELYESNFKVEEVPATRRVNSDATKRGAIAEFIIS